MEHRKYFSKIKDKPIIIPIFLLIMYLLLVICLSVVSIYSPKVTTINATVDSIVQKRNYRIYKFRLPNRKVILYRDSHKFLKKDQNVILVVKYSKRVFKSNLDIHKIKNAKINKIIPKYSFTHQHVYGGDTSLNQFLNK